MKILSIDQAMSELKTPDIGAFISKVDWQYTETVPSYFLPKDSSKQIALARVVANTFLDRGPTLLWITEFGMWEQHMDLFQRYRLSYGEMRTLADAPLHVFDPIADRDALISILSLCLFFMWGVEIVTLNQSVAITISHDEWLEYRFTKGNEDFISYFEKWIQPQLKDGTPQAH